MTGLLDEFPALSRSKWRVLGFRFGICMFGFILGLPMTTRVRITAFSISSFQFQAIIHNAYQFMFEWGFFLFHFEFKKIAHLIT